MQIIVNNILTRYTESGQGRPIVLIHGWGDNLQSFTNLQQELSINNQVIALDLPGFGQSSMPPRAWSLDDYAGFIKDFLVKIEIIPYALIGHSNGGAILIEGLGKGTLKASKLVLLASSGVRGRHNLRNKTLMMGTKIAKLPLKVLPASSQNKIRSKLYKIIDSDAYFAPEMIETFRKIVSQDVTDTAHLVKIPTLLIYGDKDMDTPVEFGKLLKDKIERSQFIEIKNAGHFVHHDAPEQVFKIIKEFINV
jgi:pimeloyl-ACP methyl ester carboxylesterase